jgi:hypothetical protein
MRGVGPGEVSWSVCGGGRERCVVSAGEPPCGALGGDALRGPDLKGSCEVGTGGPQGAAVDEASGGHRMKR